MVIKFGVEPVPEYMQNELYAAAHKLVTEFRPVAPGQQVLVTGDTSSDLRVVQAIAGAVQAIGGVPSVAWYPMLPEPMQEPPQPIAQAATAAEIWIDLAVSYQLYSPAYQAAIQNGCVYVCLTGMDVDMLVRTVGRVPYQPLKEMANWLYRRSQAASKIRVTNPAGTDLSMCIDKAGDPFWEPPPSRGGYPQMLGGQSGFMAFRESFEGILVFDGALWPPAELGLLHSPVRMRIEGGYIKKIEGGQEATIFSNWLAAAGNPYVYLLEHACYGFNPGVTRPSGRILEDERVFGCMQFGIGATPLGSPLHADGVVLDASVWLDDEQIETEGHYVHPELVEFCRAMGVKGYG
jgi:leucyl aminopeptidase (aminopeptidase T)